MHAAVSSNLITRIYATSERPKKAIVGLHGWTGNEHVFEPVAKMMKVEHAKWYFPRAPYRSDLGKGYTWFSGDDEKGWNFEKTWIGLHQLMGDIQKEGFARENIFLIGFSQGASLAMEYALRLPYAIGGIIPIAGFIKTLDVLESEATPQSTDTPVLLLHGDQDSVIPHTHSEEAKTFLDGRGHDVHLEIYNAPHKISLKSIPLVQEYISNPNHFFSAISPQ